jgi:hypothetical protein
MIQTKLVVTISIAALLLATACSWNDSPAPQPTAGSTVPASTGAPTIVVAPTAAGFNAAKLEPALMPAATVTTLLGAGYQTPRSKSTDPALPFSSAPNIAGVLTAQNVSLLYNSFQAAALPPAGRPFSVQNTVQGYPSANNATTAFRALSTTWQGTLFQNLGPQPMLAGWQESFCQTGNFTTTGGQLQQWYVCMARSGPYVATVSIGTFPQMDLTSISPVVRTYFDTALRSLQ